MKTLVSVAALLSTFAIVKGAEPVSLPASVEHQASESKAGPELSDVRDKESTASINDFRELARRAIQTNEYGLAELYFGKALNLSVPPALKADLLLDYATFLENNAGKSSKAIAVYEQVLLLFPNVEKAPDISLRLGRLHRGLGAYKSALNKFYNVLHASLRVHNGDEYQSLVQSAQFEIAETHFALGEYETAAKFYSRLKLLEMPAEAQAEVQFKSAYLRYLGKDYAGAITAAQEYLGTYSGSKSAAEAQYIQIRSLKALNKTEEALKETVKLLRSGREHGQQHPEVWAYWQQKTGSELAADLFSSGDFMNSLTVYQCLAELSDQPEVRLPAVYQIALCFERLRHFDRALEAYSFIAKQAKTAEKPKNGTVNISVDTLKEMATWRCDHLKWLIETDAELSALLNRKSPGPIDAAGFMVKPDLRSAEPRVPAAKVAG